MLDRLAAGQMQYHLRKAYPDAAVKADLLRQTIKCSQDKVERIRTSLERCRKAASLGATWKRLEKEVEAEADRVCTSFRSLRDRPGLRELIDYAEDADTERSVSDIVAMDVFRSQPILFCLDLEKDLRGIALTLS